MARGDVSAKVETNAQTRLDLGTQRLGDAEEFIKNPVFHASGDPRALILDVPGNT
jgi:hypothetical protein